MFGVPLIPAIMGGTAIILCGVAGTQTLRLSRSQTALATEKAAHAADIATWRQAGVNATLAATRRARAIEAQQNEVTDHANDTTAARLAAFRDGVRVAARADQGAPGKADLSSLPYTPSVFDGPGADTVVSKSDAGLCGEVTIRLIDAREWALKQAALSKDATHD